MNKAMEPLEKLARAGVAVVAESPDSIISVGRKGSDENTRWMIASRAGRVDIAHSPERQRDIEVEQHRDFPTDTEIRLSDGTVYMVFASYEDYSRAVGCGVGSVHEEDYSRILEEYEL